MNFPSPHHIRGPARDSRYRLWSETRSKGLGTHASLLICALALLLAACGRAGPEQATATAALGVPAPSAPPLLAATAVSPIGSETPGLVPQAGGQPLVLSDLHMVTANEGWATGWTVDRSSGGVFRTADGGVHWMQASPPGVDPTQIETTAFLDATHAWVEAPAGDRATATAAADAVVVYRTIDGGQTWERSVPLHFTSAAPGWLQFIDADHGWLMANLGASAGSMAVGIYRTVDGGLHWATVSLTAGDPSLSTPRSLPLSCNKTGVSFVNPTVGWATGHCTTGGVFFFMTRDSGRTWQPQTLPAPSGSSANLLADCDCETTPPVFASAQNGVAPVKIFTTEHEAVLYATQDGGQTWSPSKLSTNRLLRPPDFVSATDGWVTDESDIFLTRDGGRDWTPVAQLPELRLLGTFDFVDLQNGWVTGGEQVYRTTDGGKTWEALTPQIAWLAAPAGTRDS